MAFIAIAVIAEVAITKVQIFVLMDPMSHTPICIIIYNVLLYHFLRNMSIFCFVFFILRFGVKLYPILTVIRFYDKINVSYIEKRERTFTFMNVVKNIVKFKYFDEFHCIGPECRDSCCKYWSIQLSKREYLDYKKMPCSPELRSIIDTAFKRIKGSVNTSAYAEMKLKENGNCPFLGEDSLCMLQKELGENVLSLTCSVFPRLNTFVGLDTLLQSCTATCCRVVEILMQHPEGLEIVEEEYDGKDKYINDYRGSNHAIKNTHKEYPYFWNILNAKIDILQNRNFTVPERMLILGYYCQKVDSYIENGEGEKIAGLSAMLLDNELCQKIADSLKPPCFEGGIDPESLRIFIDMYRRLKANSKHSSLLDDLFDRAYKYLECEMVLEAGKPLSHRFNVVKYSDLCKTFRNIENERSYIIENLLVNFLFQYNPEKGVWGNYFDMAIFYNVLKICAPVFLPENYGDKDLAIALTYAVKMVMNSNLGHAAAERNFKAKDQYTLPYAAFLIC